MKRQGVATFTLDGGKAPRWLFQRMVQLGEPMVELLIDEYGPDEFVKRISDPVWFQSLGTVVAFDWNASGLTTTLTGALKEAIRGREKELGIMICGGKGRTSRKTPDQLKHWGRELDLSSSETNNLVYSSKMTAKVDSSLVQDGFQLYHHTFFLSKNGHWSVVQQGMNTGAKRARRYHWYSDEVEDLINEPHAGISAEQSLPEVLNLVSKNSQQNRAVSLEMVEAGYSTLKKDLQILRKHATPISQMAKVKQGSRQLTLLNLEDTEFSSHPVVNESFIRNPYFDKIFARLAYDKPSSYEALMATPGMGARSIRALSLIGEVLYGADPSYEDPARYSFAHGGKDGTPYPVDTKRYDKHIALMRQAVRKSKLSLREKDKALQRLEANVDS